MASSSLPASLFLLSVVFWQFVFWQIVAAADQNIPPVTAEPGDNVILTCEDPDQGQVTLAEWNRTDLGPESVLRYRNFQLDPSNQHRSYKNRVDLLIGQIEKGDVSLILRNTTTDDSGTYKCQVAKTNREKKLISTVSLVVAPRPPEPLPVGVTVLLVLLVLALAAAALYFLFHWKPVQQVEVEPGEKFVQLPLNVPRRLWVCKYRWSVDKVEWKDEDNKTVHVYQNDSDQPGEQNLTHRTRTKMDKNLLNTGDLSLTLLWPTFRDNKIFTCIVYNRKGDELMKKDVWLKVKVSEQVEVESGEESVLLPLTITKSLDGDVKVEWKDRDNRTVHVYQNGSDQPGEQNQIYRTRTKMDKNLLKNKNLSLTLLWPTFRDRGTFTCRVSKRDGDMLMMKQVHLWVKVLEVEVEPGEKFVLLPWRTRQSLDGDVKVEWKDRDNMKVHVYQNGSDQPGEQNQIYKDRTKMDENLLNTGDLSLTLLDPTHSDVFTCSVSRDKTVLMMKQVQLKVKDCQVEVKEGAESVLLPFRVNSDLLKGGRVTVWWLDRRNRMVHEYQKGSEQPGEQAQFYRTRTKMNKDALQTGDLSLTLSRPTEIDSTWFRCGVYMDGELLRIKSFQLNIKGTGQVQPEDTRTRTNSIDLPLLAAQLV